MQNAEPLRSGKLCQAIRLPLSLIAVLTLIAATFTWSSSAGAQNNLAPVAIAQLGQQETTAGDALQVLDGSRSFDSDGNNLEYEWEVITEVYSWVAITETGTGPDDTSTPNARFRVPSFALAERYGLRIEFRLTVTDDGNPAASNTDTVVFTYNEAPVAEIDVEANLLDEDSDEEGVDAYTVDAVIEGPGVNGNDDNEWDIRENSLLVLDGAGSSDPNGDIASYEWALAYHFARNGDRNVATGLPSPSGAQTASSITSEVEDDANDDSTLGVQTVGNITAEQSPYTAYYSLKVTDDDGQVSQVKLVKLVIHDVPAAPEVDLDVSVADSADDESSVQATQTENAYVVSPGSSLLVTSTVTDADDIDGSPTTVDDYEWDGGTAPADDSDTSDVDESVANRLVEIGDDDGGSIVFVTLIVTDSAGLSTSTTARLIVSDNTAPITADILNPNIETDDNGARTYATSDGAAGGDTDPTTGHTTGTVTLRGISFDPDQPEAELAYRWTEVVVDPTTEEVAEVDDDDAVLMLVNAWTPTISFDVPEVDAETSVVIQLAVSDNLGVETTSLVTIVISPTDAPPVADAGGNQVVAPGSFVRLNGIGSHDPDKGDSISSYEWELVGLATDPATTAVSKAVSDQVFKDLGDFMARDDDNNGVFEYPEVLTGNPGKFPFFTAPKVADGIGSVVLTFRLTVTDSVDDDSDPADGDDDTDTDTVVVTVVSGAFYSGYITGPDFCMNMSLGGPLTHPFDGDGDGIADVCSLKTTRRATVATQNALELMVAYNSEMGGEHTPPASFQDLVVGRAATEDDSVTAVVGTCEDAPDDLGDSLSDLAKDACDTDTVSDPPPPVDPVKSGQFFSGAINGPNFCTNMSLGGPRTYAMDSDSDGIADICSLPFTRREAVARQQAMEMFKAHPQFRSFLVWTCAQLGTIDFGDDADDLSADECSKQADGPKGTPLPAPTS